MASITIVTVQDRSFEFEADEYEFEDDQLWIYRRRNRSCNCGCELWTTPQATPQRRNNERVAVATFDSRQVTVIYATKALTA